MAGKILVALKWLFASAALLLMFVAFIAYRDAARVFEVMANGVEATALVEGGAQNIRLRTADSYWVDLVWTDAAGALRRSERTAIGGVLARQLIADAAAPPVLAIKYLPDQPGVAPVVVRQAADRREADRLTILAAGIGAAASVVGFLTLFWLDRRKISASRINAATRKRR
jgi:hypothetical protein